MRVHQVWVDGIRNALLAADVAGGNVEKERERPTRDEILPICLIAFEKDVARADGDARHGAPSFTHEASVVVAYFDRAASGPALRAKLYSASDLVLETLLGNLAAWEGVDAGGVAYLEGVAGVEVSYNLPPEGQSVAGSVEIKLRLLHRTIFNQPSPDTLPDFHGASVGVAAPDGSPQLGITITVPEPA